METIKQFKRGNATAIAIIVVLVVIVAVGIVYFTQTRQPDGVEQVNPLANFRGKINTYDMAAKPFEFSVKEIRVKKGEAVRINLTNIQGMHDLAVDGYNTRTKILQVNEKATLEFIADKTGTFDYYCSVGNHRQMGMVGKLIVE